MGEAAAEQEERVDVLRAMLTVAEDELRAKDAQIEYIQQMLAASEQARLASDAAARARRCAKPSLDCAQELRARDEKICGLSQANTELQNEIGALNELFERYIAKAEARVQSNPGLAQVRASKVAAASARTSAAGEGRAAAGGLVADAKGDDEASDGGDTIPSDLSDDHIGEDVVYADEPARGSSLTSSAYFSARSPVDDGVE